MIASFGEKKTWFNMWRSHDRISLASSHLGMSVVGIKIIVYHKKKKKKKNVWVKMNNRKMKRLQKIQLMRVLIMYLKM